MLHFGALREQIPEPHVSVGGDGFEPPRYRTSGLQPDAIGQAMRTTQTLSAPATDTGMVYPEAESAGRAQRSSKFGSSSHPKRARTGSDNFFIHYGVLNVQSLSRTFRFLGVFGVMSQGRRDSNPRFLDLESSAVAAEPRPPVFSC